MENEKYSFSYNLEDNFSIEDVENRRLYLNTGVDEDAIDSLAYHIMRYNRLDKDIPIEQRKPIILYINSPGGCVTDGYAVIDTIMASKTPVYTVNLGIAYSMGFMIFISGQRRYAMPHSTFLLHEGFVGAIDATNKARDKIEFEAGVVSERNKQYVLSQTNITNEQYEENRRREWYFYPEEGKDFGVVTHIVGVDCDIDEVI